jgi:hypothetical protein
MADYNPGIPIEWKEREDPREERKPDSDPPMRGRREEGQKLKLSMQTGRPYIAELKSKSHGSKRLDRILP